MPIRRKPGTKPKQGRMRILPVKPKGPKPKGPQSARKPKGKPKGKPKRKGRFTTLPFK